jgi:predicted GH43/DUF377 family glycosyl hydrolase
MKKSIPQKWEKIGHIYQPDGRAPWLHSHAQLPVADHIGGDLYRVYFAGRTAEQRSHVGYVELDITDPTNILKVAEHPVLVPGPIGFFDEHGVFPASIVTHEDRKHLYYIGWNQGCKQPLFYANIGLAVSNDGGLTFEKWSKAPIMARSEHDPCLVTSPHVFIDDNIWRMTYVSGTGWEESNGELKSFYHIKYAESTDGIQWRRDGRIAIDYCDANETNIARSWVIREADGYRMWYSYVYDGTPYRIGYAESDDCLTWTRKDSEAGIAPSATGFDSEMTCYPNVFVHDGVLHMFYNGNRFGHDGFGLARAVE